MSGLAVVLGRDGSPADAALLGALLARLAHRGGDGEGSALAGPLALGHLAFRTTPEDGIEAQPLREETGRYLAAVDGRVDNRDDLARGLGVPPAEAAALSDARLLLLVFARWGIAGLARPVGPFALAVWDTVEHRLVLARDGFGGRPLSWAVIPGGLVAASEEQALLACPGVDGSLDERRVAQFLGIAELDDDATFFAGVKDVPPGCAVVAGAAPVRVERFWEPVPRPILRLRDDREYGDAVRETLRVVLSAQVRAAGRVALQLSGGLDSSALAGLAAPLVPGPPLLAVSWVFEELESCDERAYIDPVVRHCGLEPVQFAGDGDWPLRDFAARRHNPSSPEDGLYRRLVTRAHVAAAEAGARVVLNGMFGDHLYSGCAGWLWERWTVDGPFAALAALPGAVGALGLGRALRAAAAPREPRGWYRRWRASPRRAAPWMTPRAAELLAAHGGSERDGHGFPRPAQARSVLSPRSAHGVAGETFHTACDGVEVRHPFRDRRLLELLLSLPSDQLDRPGRARPVLREAMRGVVPEAVRERVGKASLVELFRRGVCEREAAAVRALLERGRPTWRQWVREAWRDEGPPGGRARELDELVLFQCVLLVDWLDRGAGVCYKRG